mmetsp:Transcript_4294/g.12115  ORF Transcript_4294/g.12115 Transcript_4294/m.12115 type:complete len:211 (-) Transcript_4294:84-716(-)
MIRNPILFQVCDCPSLASRQRIKVAQHISTGTGGIPPGAFDGCIVPKVIPPILRSEPNLERSVGIVRALHRPGQPVEIGTPPTAYHLVRVDQGAVGGISPLHLVHLPPIPSPFVVYPMEALPLVVGEHGQPLHLVLMPLIEIDRPRHTEFARLDLFGRRFESVAAGDGTSRKVDLMRKQNAAQRWVRTIVVEEGFEGRRVGKKHQCKCNH